MFCAWPCYAYNVSLLKGIIPNHGCWNLTCKYYKGNRIHIRCGNACYCVCGTGTRGYKANPYLAACPCVAVSGMNTSLLMSHKDMFYWCFKEGIINGEYRTAGVSEYGIHTLFNPPPLQRGDTGGCLCKSVAKNLSHYCPCICRCYHPRIPRKIPFCNLRWYGSPFLFSIAQSFFINKQLYLSIRDINGYLIPFFNQCNRAAFHCLWRNVPDTWPLCPARESAVSY